MFFDLVVLGGGPGGYSAAIRASQNGLAVALIDQAKLGGTCLNSGCVPSKAWIATAETVDHAKLLNTVAAEPFEFVIDFEKMKLRQRRITTQFQKSLDVLMKKNNVTVIMGRGKFISERTITIDGDEPTTISFGSAIIATGSRPMKLFDLGPEKTLYSSSIFDMERLPKSMLILGAGPIGCELSGVMARLGVEITMIELMPRILPLEDHEISSQMEREFKKLKVKIVKDVKVDSVIETSIGITAITNGGQRLSAEKILISAGREPNTDNIGLSELGIKLGSNGELMVDGDLRIKGVNNIFAVGDVAGQNMLAYTASHEGVRVADAICGKVIPIDMPPIPSVVFTIPEIGSVGKNEEQAPDNAKVGRFLFRGLSRAHCTDEITGFVKVIADGNTDRIIGMHIIGPRATEMIHIGTVALAAKITATNFGSMLFAHPTLGECIWEAANDVNGRSLHK